MSQTKRVSVEDCVICVVHYTGQEVLDVPVDKLGPDGDIDVEWVRCNFPHEKLDVDDTDILEDRRGGEEYAHYVAN